MQQSKFNADGSPPDPTYQWIVPVTIGTATDPNKHSFLLESADTEVRLEGVSADECLSLNPGYRGFYRVQYSAEMLKNILEQVKQLKLTPSDRLGLHNDLYAQVCERAYNRGPMGPIGVQWDAYLCPHRLKLA